jgi:small subunit ribosomal protein S21
MHVEPREGESFDQMLRRFKTSMDKSGILREYKRKRYFKTNSELQREKAKAAARRRARRPKVTRGLRRSVETRRQAYRDGTFILTRRSRLGGGNEPVGVWAVLMLTASSTGAQVRRDVQTARRWSASPSHTFGLLFERMTRFER